MKDLFDIDYKDHIIKVTNKWNDCSLMIDNAVVDTYRAVVAGNFTLKGDLEIEEEKVEIVFELRNGFPRCILSLTANGQQLATKKLFR